MGADIREIPILKSVRGKVASPCLVDSLLAAMAPTDTATRAPDPADLPASLVVSSVPPSSPLWPRVLIALAVFLVYANSFPGGFFFDDDAAIVQNESIRDLTDLRAVVSPPVQAGIGGRPFANLTYALNYALSGYAPWSYHAVNLGLHAAAALLLFALTRRTLLLPVIPERFRSLANDIALVVALFWGLHPLQTNIVDYASQRTEGLMGVLYLFTLYGFLRAVTSSSRRWVAVTITTCFLGMATKEVMVTAPVMVLLFDRTFLAGSFVAALKRRWPIYTGLALSWALLSVLMLTSKLTERGIGFGLGQSGFTYALTECRAVLRYLQLAVWPNPLVFDYGPLYLHGAKEAWPSITLLALVLAGTSLAVWRAPLIGFAAAWFFVTLAPSSSIVPVVQQPCAENRVYLPLAGIAVLMTLLGFRLFGRRAQVCLFVISGLLGIATVARNPAFASELAIWTDTVPKRTENARAANNLGNALLKQNRTLEAMPHFETAIRLSPSYSDAHNNRGVSFLRLKKYNEALVEFRTAIEHRSDYADAHYNVGEAYIQLGKPTEAITALRRSLQLEPKNSKAYNNLGIALLDIGQVDESIKAERQALALNPEMPEAHYNLGNSLARAYQPAAALAEYDLALKFDPKFARAHNNAGVLLLQQGKATEAEARFVAALQLNPNYPEAKRNLAIVRNGTQR